MPSFDPQEPAERGRSRGDTMRKPLSLRRWNLGPTFQNQALPLRCLCASLRMQSGVPARPRRARAAD